MISSVWRCSSPRRTAVSMTGQDINVAAEPPRGAQIRKKRRERMIAARAARIAYRRHNQETRT